MKVGTDGVMLAAWAPHPHPRRILDIGTGTGLIALILAQRFRDAQITAIEPDDGAALDAHANFSSQELGQHISLVKTSVKSFRPQGTYDLIVSNPPFFRNSMKSPDTGRNTARHIAHFGPDELLASAAWLSDGGVLAGIYPVEVFQSAKETALKHHLHLIAQVTVFPLPEKPPHRVIFAYAKQPRYMDGPLRTSLTIETGKRHEYSSDYKDLTSPYYLDRVFNR